MCAAFPAQLSLPCAGCLAVHTCSSAASASLPRPWGSPSTRDYKLVSVPLPPSQLDADHLDQLADFYGWQFGGRRAVSVAGHPACMPLAGQHGQRASSAQQRDEALRLPCFLPRHLQWCSASWRLSASFSLAHERCSLEP